MAELRKNRMMTPGPTEVPAEVLLAAASPQIHHRTGAFREVYADVCRLAGLVFATSRPVFPIGSSGSGAMECAIANLVPPGSRPLVIESGWFGKRWADICRAYGLSPVVLDIPWGQVVDPSSVARHLAADPACPAVLVQLCETSTGVIHPVQALQEICSPTNALLVVDAISGLGAEPCETDAWNLDCVLTGSQKALMTTPGLAFITVSERAWPRIEAEGHPRFYFDLRKYRKGFGSHDHPFTPPTAMLRAQRAALRLIADEGLPTMIARHARLARATRAAVEALGLKLFAASPGNVLTSVLMPEGHDSGAFVKLVRDAYGVTLAGAQGPYKGKFFRIGHLGCVDDNDIVAAIGAIERALNEIGVRVPLGAGVAAAQRVFLEARMKKAGTEE